MQQVGRRRWLRSLPSRGAAAAAPSLEGLHSGPTRRDPLGCIGGTRTRSRSAVSGSARHRECSAAGTCALCVWAPVYVFVSWCICVYVRMCVCCVACACSHVCQSLLIAPAMLLGGECSTTVVVRAFRTVDSLSIPPEPLVVTAYRAHRTKVCVRVLVWRINACYGPPERRAVCTACTWKIPRAVTLLTPC